MAKLKQLLFTFLAICFTSSLISQHSLYEKHQSSFSEIKTTVSPFSKHPLKSSNIEGFSRVEWLKVDADLLSDLYTSHPQSFGLDIALHDQNETLLLIKNDIFLEDTQVLSGDGRNLKGSIDLGHHYYGIVAGKNNSLVSVSAFADELVIFTIIDGVQTSIVKNHDTQDYIMYDKAAVLNPPTHDCHTDSEAHYIGNAEEKVVYDENNCVNMYIEVDYDIYNDFGSISATSSYITGAFNQVSTLYANESIDFNLSELVIWDTVDPYTGPSTVAYLNQFQDEINGNYNGDLAHLIGYNGGGGVAYVDVLCNSYYGIGYSAITSSYSTVPTYSWTIEVLTHEIGHNLGSKHTHACAWNGNNTAIDGCGPAAGYSEGCDAALPAAGTIMSYCHLVGGVGIDFNLGFGPQPGDKIRDEVYNASCLSACAADDGCTTEGDPCDDGDVCTTGDTIDSNCNCVGNYTDDDQDGYCVGEDPDDNNICVPVASDPSCNADCNLVSFHGFENGWDLWNDGGSDCARVLSDNSSSGNYSARLRDNSGTASSVYTDNLAMAAAESIMVEFSFYPYSMETNEDFFLEISVNGGSSYSIVEDWKSGTDFSNNNYYQESINITGYAFSNNTRIRFRCDASSNADQVFIDDVYIHKCAVTIDGGCTQMGQPCDDNDPCTLGEVLDSDCNCNGGVYTDADGDGYCVGEDPDDSDACNPDDSGPDCGCAAEDDVCDDGDPCTIGETYDADCNCNGGVYTDVDGDGYCIGEDPDDNDACNPDNSGPDCGCSVVGDPCDDGDACTVGETYDIDCNCNGGIFQDSDNDGVCDADDVCPNMDDNLIGTSCDDGDVCTINDVYQSNCACEGLYVDADNDGYCVGDDADDNDACVPDASAPACDTGTPCVTIDVANFESGWGSWNDGGSDCSRVNSSYSPEGNYSIRIRDNSGAPSAMYTDILNMAGYVSATVNFSFQASSMETNEDFFLEVSTNGGSTYSVISEWDAGDEFVNNFVYHLSVEVTGISFTSNTRFRFRCDASSNADKVYIDDILIEACTSGGGALVMESNDDIEINEEMSIDFDLRPNPIKQGNDLQVLLNKPIETAHIVLFDMSGRQVYSSEYFGEETSQFVVNTEDLLTGAYVIMIQTSETRWTKKVIIH